MSALAISFRQPVLPWATSAEDEERFRRIWRSLVAAVLLLGLVLPWLPRPPVERKEALAAPPPLAKLLLERPPVTLPPPPKPAATPAQEAPRPEAKTVEPPPKATVPKEIGRAHV